MLMVWAVMAVLGAVLYAGEITLAWDPPVTNVDGSPLIDLAGYRLYYAPLVVSYSEAGGVITSSVISTGAFVSVWTTNTQITLTLPSTVYQFCVTSVASLGIESLPSSNLLCRVGSPSTIKIVRRK
jgi:hypothetical protein